MSYSKKSNIPIELLPGVGPRTAKVLKSLDIHTVSHFKKVPEKMLLELFGPSIVPVHRQVQNKTYSIKKRSFAKKIHLAMNFMSFL